MGLATLNRPFTSYVLTQSCLVVIVLAASFIATELLNVHFGIEVSRLTVSLWLVGLSQLPTAMLYANRESRTLSNSEGWVFGLTFVVVTLAAECAIQFLAGQALPKFGVLYQLLSSGNWELLFAASCGVILGVFGAAYGFKTLFGLSVRNNLEGEAPPLDTKWLRSVAWVKQRATIRKFTSHRQGRDHARSFRRILLGSNIAVFALSLIILGPEYLQVLSLSIPLSILFSVVVVANDVAKTEPEATLLKRCWKISIAMLPLTVTCMLLLGLSDLYLAYLASHPVEAHLMADLGQAVAQSDISAAEFILAAINLATFFAICLIANAALLILFSKLIRPLVVRAHSGRRPVYKPLALEPADLAFPSTETPVWVPRSTEILSVLARSSKAKE